MMKWQQPAFDGTLKRSEQVSLHLRKFDKLVKNLYLIYNRGELDRFFSTRLKAEAMTHDV
jgi:hypothetical protein